MDCEFDIEKDAANLGKHGVSLEFGAPVFGAPVFDDPDHISLASIRPIDGEDRYKVIGMVNSLIWTAVHVYRGERVRFISVRRSNTGEQRAYDSYRS